MSVRLLAAISPSPMPVRPLLLLAFGFLTAIPLRGQTTIRVNCGGSSYVDGAGNTWNADFGFSGSSSSLSVGSTIDNTSTQPLYQSERFTTSNGALSYTFSVTNGSYGVTLKWAEITADYARRFDVIINGRQVLTNHSIYLAGPNAYNTAVDRTFTVPVTNGSISIQFVPKVSSATISAIEILPSIAFTDIPTNKPYYSLPHFMRENRITSGCTTTTFCYDQAITRGEMAVLIIRGLFWALAGTPENFTYSTSPYFTDVLPSHPWFKYIQKMRDLGITSGCTSTTYCVNNSITWGEMTVFGVRAWEYRTRGQVTNSFCTISPADSCPPNTIPNTDPRRDVLNLATPVYFQSDAGTGYVWYNFVQKAVNLRMIDFVSNGTVYGSCLQELTGAGNQGSGYYCGNEPIPRGESSFFVVRGTMGVYDPYSPGSSYSAGTGGISPARAEINLGAIPIDQYDDTHNAVLSGLNGCRDSSLSVRSCIKKILSPDTSSGVYSAANYGQQGVTGVRFFFPLGNTSSTPFHSDGTVDTTDWIPRLQSFFADLKSYGIQRVIPTPVFVGSWSGMQESTQQCDGCFAYKTRSLTTCGSPPDVTLYFYPWTPWGFRKVINQQNPNDISYNIDCVGLGQHDDYGNAAGQPQGLFSGWNGWDNFFNLFQQILIAANAAGMAIGEFDLENEVNVGGAEVEARLIYDNKTIDTQTGLPGVPVVDRLRQIATLNGFSSDIVTMSTPLNRGWRVSADCTSPYDDSAFLLVSSALNAAFAGQPFGEEDILNPLDNNGLACKSPGGQIHGPQLPAAPLLGVVKTVDVHAHFCVAGDGNGNAGYADYSCTSIQDCLIDNPSNISCPSLFNATQHAQIVFNALDSFLYKYGHTSARLGEANMVQPCADETPSLARQAADGLRSSTLRQAYRSNLFINAWNSIQDSTQCTTNPVLLTPDNPFAQ